jgi:perosamine synthetase
MSELHAAIGVAQLERFDELVDDRTRVASRYNTLLANVPGVEIPTIVPATTRMSWFVYAVRLDASIDRNDLIRRLQAENVPTRPYFPPIHLHAYFRKMGHAPGEFPITESISPRMLALPFHGELTDDEIQFVVDALKRLIP